MRYVILFLTLLLAACEPAPLVCDGPPPEAPAPAPEAPNSIAPAGSEPIRVCVDVAADQRERVLQGVEGWRKVTAPWRGWDLQPAGTVDGCDLQIIEVAEGEVCTLGASACVQTLGGLDLERPFGVVYQVVGRYEVNPAFTTLHEVGHLLGLDHVDGGIMQAGPTASMWGGRWECPDLESIERLEAHLNLSLGRCVQ
jgi:hypothetical protein